MDHDLACSIELLSTREGGSERKDVAPRPAIAFESSHNLQSVETKS